MTTWKRFQMLKCLGQEGCPTTPPSLYPIGVWPSELFVSWTAPLGIFLWLVHSL
jgi:hypothetical protein